MLPFPGLRILLDYRPALRARTGVGEYAHELAAAILRQMPAGDTLTLFSSSWKDRLSPGTLPGARVIDRRVPVTVLNAAWHRAGWPPIEMLAGPHRIVSIHTREAVDELGLKPGMEAVAVVKATNVIVEVPR